MKNFENVFVILLILLFQKEVYSQESIEIGTNKIIQISKENSLFTFESNEDKFKTGNILAFTTIPEEDYLKPGFIYASLNNTPIPSPDNRDFVSQKLGRIYYLHI